MKNLLSIILIALTLVGFSQKNVVKSKILVTSEARNASFVDSAAKAVCCKDYKEYVAILNQTGTSAPTVTVIKNELGGSLIWTRVAPGFYMGTLVAAFTTGKVVAIPNTSIAAGGTGTRVCLAQPFPISLDNIGLFTYVLKNSGTFTLAELSDGLMSNQLVMLRVYN